MENCMRPHDSAKNYNLSVVEDEKEKVKDFVCKHFREASDGSLNNPEEAPLNVHAASTKKDKTLVRAHCKIQQRAVFSGKILSFGCSVCKDNLTFSPNDLLKHFQAVHEGTPPTYPCDLCDFITNEFQVLQRHRIEHRNTLVTCELCNDNVQYSLLLLTRHYMMCHSMNGLFKCDWCDFTTVDAGTFVQHIHHHNECHWKCSKCGHISLNEEDHQSHMKAHSGKFPFTCPICGYGAARSEHLKRHTAGVHREEAERRNAIKPVEDGGSSANVSTDSKGLKKNFESPETQRMPKLNCLSGSVTNQNGRVIKQEVSLEESSHIMDANAAKNSSRTSPDMLQESENSSCDVGGHTNANGLTVLMVKNKISLPPNCTTKVMGFKMVDGKKHLVLKVIPTAKHDLPTQNHSLVDDAGPLLPNPGTVESNVSAENGQCPDSKSLSPRCLAASPKNGSCIQMDQDDIMAVKVKIEEEETSICSINSTPHAGDVSEQTNQSLTSADTLPPSTNELNHVNSQSGRVTDETTEGDAQKTLLSKPVSRKGVENCGAIDESSLTDGNERVNETNKRNSHFSPLDTDLPSQITPESNQRTRIEIQNQNSHPKHLEPPSQNASVVKGSGAFGTEKNTQNTPNQEVFSFHNYSKEMLSPSLSTNQNLDNNLNDAAHQENGCESSQSSSTLAESLEHFTENACDKVNECIASVDHPLAEDNPDSVLQDFNIIKIEEDSIPISTKQCETKSSSVSIGSFVEEHSNAIITQQLNKERTGSSGASNDSVKQTKTTLRILQLPERKQPVLLRATDNRFAKPVQVKAPPGFKLITSSSNPQINVSYMKKGFDKSGNTTSVTVTPNTKVIGVPAANPRPAEKGPTFVSAVQRGVRTTSNHYLINGQGFSGPVLLSSTLPSAAADKLAKTQQTCFLVQRSVPLVQTPSTSSFKLAGSQLSTSSRPVLAMPINSADKSSSPQTGRQAFLLRYISPPKSGLFLNNQETKAGALHTQTSETSGNKVIFKIVSPTGNLLSTGASATNNQPLILATRPQTQCFLVSNKTNPPASSGAKNSLSIHSTPQKSNTLPSQVNGKLQPCEADRLLLAPRSIRPPSQRKRRRKALYDELPPTTQKARRLSNKVQTEKEPVLWKPVAKEVERMLRLSPFSSVQQIKCPRRYQPVVVLNHPDADLPEVANIMKVVNRYKGAVTKVSLSEKTVQALSDFSALGNDSSTGSASSDRDGLRPRPVQSSVRERFLLKMKLRKKSAKKYEVVKTLSACSKNSAVFDCWFCGRHFNNQEDWIGHGQRHLMEATRDWNQLF